MSYRNTSVPASYIVFKREGRILLLLRENTGYMDGKWSLPAGHVEEGENFTDCAVREAEEETGAVLAVEDLIMAHIMYRRAGGEMRDQRVDTFFTAETWSGKIINREPHKCAALTWFDPDDLPKETIPYIREALNLIDRGVSFSEYGWDNDN